MSSGPFLRRVVIENYRSIESCNVELGPVTILVGPNGSGKSNFLDAIRFVSDALRTSLAQAIRDRGGIKEIRRRSPGDPDTFAIRLEFHLPNGHSGHYAFRLRFKGGAGFEVYREQLYVSGATRLRSGEPTKELALIRYPVAWDVYRALARIAHYNLNPGRISDTQIPDDGDFLLGDGGNASSVLRALSPVKVQRVERYLQQITPGVEGVESVTVGHKEVIRFHQRHGRMTNAFYADSMSDGTLRAFAILLALFQSPDRPLPLIAIEEPEAALHPGTAAVFLDAFREVSDSTQVLITSHSPDLLDEIDLERETLLAVHSEDGNTQIAPIDQASRKVVRKGLYTPGELLRLNQLAPDQQAIKPALIFEDGE